MSTPTTAPGNGSWLLRTAIAGVLLLAAGAFVLSYSALHAVAVAAGINPSLAGLYPLIIDGFITIASLAALSLRGHGPRVTWYPWSLLGGFFTVSVWCNALHAASRNGEVTMSGSTAAFVSAMPPIALGLAIHLLILMLRPPTRPTPGQLHRDAAATTPTPAAIANGDATRGRLNGNATPARTRKRTDQPSPRPTTAHPQTTALGAPDNGNRLHQRAAAELRQARETNTEISGAELGRRLGISTRHGRRLLNDLADSDLSEPNANMHQTQP